MPMGLGTTGAASVIEASLMTQCLSAALCPSAAGPRPVLVTEPRPSAPEAHSERRRVLDHPTHANTSAPRAAASPARRRYAETVAAESKTARDQRRAPRVESAK